MAALSPRGRGVSDCAGRGLGPRSAIHGHEREVVGQTVTVGVGPCVRVERECVGAVVVAVVVVVGVGIVASAVAVVVSPLGRIQWEEVRGVCVAVVVICLLYTSPSPRDQRGSRMPSSA